MAAKTSDQLTSEDADARLYVLERASEDCYGVKEFINNLLALYTPEGSEDGLAMPKRTLAQLSDEGLVRLHSGWQCSGDRSAPEELTIRGSEVASLSEDAWIPYTEAMVCVCPTDLTQEAYKAAWLSKNGEPSA